MIVKNISEVIGTKDEIHSDGWTSRRLLLKKDGMGFSFQETIIEAGAGLQMHYKNHLEGVYCVAGSGTIVDKHESMEYPIAVGTLYALDKNDRHILKADEEMKIICVFNPPCTGQEVHEPDGSYALAK